VDNKSLMIILGGSETDLSGKKHFSTFF